MVRLIREEKYAEMMTGVVEPGLKAMREEIELPLEGGGTLHAEVYNRLDARRAVLMLHGYTESAEKLREMVWYFVQEGFSVFTYDHRGHGRSVRGVMDTSITHVDNFGDYLRDMELVVEKIVRPRMGDAPLSLFAHSMGGAVGAFALIEHGDWFDRAVLTAPMIAPVTKPLSRLAARKMGDMFVKLGRGRERAFVGKPFDPAREKFETSHDTSRARFDYYQQKRNTQKHLQNCSPTYSWVREAAGVTEPLLEGAPKIQTPLLLCQAAQDTIVGLEEQNQFVSLVPGAQIVRFDSKHELYFSHQEVMKEYVQTVVDFLKGEPVEAIVK